MNMDPKRVLGGEKTQPKQSRYTYLLLRRQYWKIK